MIGFSWYELRTTSLGGARDFYPAVTGLTLRDEGDRRLVIVRGTAIGELSPLPERAAALGAPSHWLGHLGPVDVAETSGRLVALGATPLGPVRSVGGAEVAVLRDPVGAVVAITSRPRPKGIGSGLAGIGLTGDGLAWRQLYTPDVARSLAVYTETFGWRRVGELDLGAEWGISPLVAWGEALVPAAGVLDSTRRPGVHPHWMFYFPVDDFDRALREVVAHGGRVIVPPVTLADGARVAPCEDPQGAMFGLHQSA